MINTYLVSVYGALWYRICIIKPDILEVHCIALGRMCEANTSEQSIYTIVVNHVIYLTNKIK